MQVQQNLAVHQIVARLKVNDEELSTLHLAHIPLTHAHVKSISEGLWANTCVTYVDLAGNSLGNGGAMELCEMFRRNNSVAKIVLDVNGITHGDFFKGLTANRKITQVGLYGNFLEDKGLKAIADVLADDSVVEFMDLGANGVGDVGARCLGECLTHNESVTSLDLRMNNIGDEGMTAIASALKHNTSLTQLDLSSNKIGNSGATALADALRCNYTLTSITLHRSTNIGQAGFHQLGLSLVACPWHADLHLEGVNLSKIVSAPFLTDCDMRWIPCSFDSTNKEVVTSAFQEKCLAFAQGMHPRLGKSSILHLLDGVGQDVFDMIAEQYWCSPLRSGRQGRRGGRLGC